MAKQAPRQNDPDAHPLPETMRRLANEEAAAADAQPAESALPVKCWPGTAIPDIRVLNPPRPVDSPINLGQGKNGQSPSRPFLPPEIAKSVGVPRAIVRGFTNPTPAPEKE
jgi:hypothetical protein